MPIITGYKLKKRRWGQCFAVELNGQPWIEVLDEVMVARGLARGLELSPKQIRDIEREAAALAAKRRLAHYLACRLKTRAQARRYAMQRLEASEEEAERLANWAIERGLVDDRVYAEAKARSRKARAATGPRRLQAELREAGVGRELADQAAAQLGGRDDQRQACANLLASKGQRWSRLEPMKRRQRAYAFLARRGFESEPARDAIEEAAKTWDREFEASGSE